MLLIRHSLQIKLRLLRHLLLPFQQLLTWIIYHLIQRHVTKIIWILPTSWPIVIYNLFQLLLGEVCLCFFYLDPPMGMGAVLIPTEWLLEMGNSSLWQTKVMPVWKYSLLVFLLVMTLQLRQYVHGICWSLKWQLQPSSISIRTFVSKNIQIQTTVSLVDLMLVLSLLLLPLRKYCINLMFPKSLLLLLSLQLLPLLKLLPSLVI